MGFLVAIERFENRGSVRHDDEINHESDLLMHDLTPSLQCDLG